MCIFSKSLVANPTPYPVAGGAAPVVVPPAPPAAPQPKQNTTTAGISRSARNTPAG